MSMSALNRNCRIAGLALLAALAAGTAMAAEPIAGSWKTASGETAVIADCGCAFCVTLKTGKYAGQQIGRLSGKDGHYEGELTDPAARKTYNGSADLSGEALNLKGCVLKLFCKSQTWKKL